MNDVPRLATQTMSDHVRLTHRLTPRQVRRPASFARSPSIVKPYIITYRDTSTLPIRSFFSTALALPSVALTQVPLVPSVPMPQVLRDYQPVTA
jgi:hypothetical protein